MIEIAAFLTPVISEALKTLLGVGAKKFEQSDVLKNLRLVVRERLIREITFNLAVLEDERLLFEERIIELDINVIEFVFSQPLPLKYFLTTSLPKNAELHLPKLKGRGWRVENYSEINLLERIWLRISVAEVRSKHEASPGDIKYLQNLLFCLRDSLSEQN